MQRRERVVERAALDRIHLVQADARRELGALFGWENAERVGLAEVEAVERGTHTDELASLWEEMTMVRRSAPAGAQW